MTQIEIPTVGPLTEAEQDELQDLILATPDCPGAEAFPLLDGYEVHPRGEPGVDFPRPVQDWLALHGFARAVDRERGPFYYRPMPLVPLAEAAERLGVTAHTLRQQASAGRLRAVKRGRDWYVTEAEIERYAREQRGRPGPKGGLG